MFLARLLRAREGDGEPGDPNQAAARPGTQNEPRCGNLNRTVVIHFIYKDVPFDTPILEKIKNLQTAVFFFKKITEVLITELACRVFVLRLLVPIDPENEPGTCATHSTLTSAVSPQSQIFFFFFFCVPAGYTAK